jgi:hypothetical protein
MRRLQCALILAALFSAPLAVADSKTAEEDRGLCAADEQVIFSCRIKKSRKAASVCAEGKNLAYRVGKPGKIELQFPSAPGPGRENFKHKRLPSDGEEDTYFSFDNAGVHYEIQTSVPTYKGQQQDHAAKSSGTLAVTASGRPKAVELKCGDALIIQWPKLKGVLPPGEFGFE